MHIQERTDTTLTTCTKMTEEVDRRHVVNGNGSGNGDDVHSPAHTPSGGRLKFFKDGKFILELVRGCAREGERSSWVSVPRKTFWPPAAAPHPPPRTDRAASLSVSDDNSSIQSSPWQRDHCWKQSNPRKNISKELALYYCRPANVTNSALHPLSWKKRRRPHDTELNPQKSLTNGIERNGDKYHYLKHKKPYKLRVYTKSGSYKRKDLGSILDRLKEKVLLPPVNAKLASCKQEHTMVSPRKRILREMERVSLEDGAKRRARPPAPAPGPSHTRKSSAYSISSLLMPDEVPRRYAPSPESRPPAPPPVYRPYYREQYYGYLPPPLYRPPLWPALPPAWPAHQLYSESAHDQHSADMPLNLSKH